MLLRAEPTWGDVDVLIRVLLRLKPTNASQLAAAFSSGYASARALQTIRNAASHNDHQAAAEINTLQSLYIIFPIGHPTHTLFWIEPNSKDFLVTQAIHDLIAVGEAAIY
jgi:hypothetical protein